MNTKRIELGDTAKDHGCERITLQPQKLDKDGKLRETQTFDVDQCSLVKKAVRRTPMSERLRALANTGGPRPEPVQRRDPTGR